MNTCPQRKFLFLLKSIFAFFLLSSELFFSPQSMQILTVIPCYIFTFDVKAHHFKTMRKKSEAKKDSATNISNNIFYNFPALRAVKKDVLPCSTIGSLSSCSLCLITTFTHQNLFKSCVHLIKIIHRFIWQS